MEGKLKKKKKKLKKKIRKEAEEEEEDYEDLGENGQVPFLKKPIQHFAIFSKLIREISLF